MRVTRTRCSQGAGFTVNHKVKTMTSTIEMRSRSNLDSQSELENFPSNLKKIAAYPSKTATLTQIFTMDPQATVSRKRKAPPVDPNNSEVVRLARIAERKKQKLTEATPKNGPSNTPVMANVNRSRAASVEDIDAINPNTIIESSEDDNDETHTAPTKGKSSRAVSVEDFEDIANIQSSHRPKPRNSNTVIESSEGEDEVDQSESEQPTESAEAELGKS
jgi:hypothetical protein